jgi:hypothetical protein
MGSPFFFDIGIFMTPTSTLEAINIMLSSIGETPVNSLESGLVDAEMAEMILNATSREIQSRGWKFNTEKKYRITPATTSGEIILPSNALKADLSVETGEFDLVQRGNRMYDLLSHSYAIGKTVELDIVVFLDFELLPEAARHYITVKASRTFQDRTVGSDTLHGFQEKDETWALVEMKDAEADTGDYTIFDNYAVSRVLNRNISTSIRRG